MALHCTDLALNSGLTQLLGNDMVRATGEGFNTSHTLVLPACGLAGSR